MSKGRKLIKGVNDIITLRPYLVNEWDYENNKDKPEEFTYGSSYKAHWVCKFGHHWQASIYERYKGTGCPICSKGLNTSYPEQFLYSCIKQLYAKTISRGKFEGYEFDVTIPELKTCIEYSGEHWEHNNSNSKLKLCNDYSVRYIEIIESRALNNELVMISDHTYKYGSYNNKEEFILKFLEVALNINTTHIDIEKAKCEAIQNSKRNGANDNKLSNNIKLTHEWSGKNITKPDDYTEHSGHKVWWKCSTCGHEWQAIINARSRGRGCPKCKGSKTLDRNIQYINKQLESGNSLLNFDEELCKEWDYSLNDIGPDSVTPGSNRKVWWTCKLCGHHWQSMIYSRAKLGRGCPKCKGTRRISM